MKYIEKYNEQNNTNLKHREIGCRRKYFKDNPEKHDGCWRDATCEDCWNDEYPEEDGGKESYL